MKGNINASAHQDILDNAMLSTLWKQFVEGPVLFQHDCDPVHKARSIKTCSDEFGMEELDLLAQSPDLKPIQHLWDDLKQRLHVRPSHPTSVPDLTNAVLDRKKCHSKILCSLPRIVESVITALGRPTL